MNNIKEHIKSDHYKPVYLLYGTEAYLKNLYKNKLKIGIMGDGDRMNFSHFEGKGIDIHQVIENARTLPFFSLRRLVLIENSGLFKVQSDFTDYLKDLPDTTHIVFVESVIDKRNRLYKAVKALGTISEMNGLDLKNLKLWVATILDQDNKKITSNTIDYLLNKTGTDMENIKSELEKLICYAYDRDVITAQDIDAVCITQISNKIFQMIDAIAFKDSTKALDLYYDLLALREKPMSILFLITRHFNLLIQVKELHSKGYNHTLISQKTGIPPYAVNKYNQQGNNFSKSILKEALTSCVDIEEKIKTGRLIDKMGVEMLIVTYSTK